MLAATHTPASNIWAARRTAILRAIENSPATKSAGTAAGMNCTPRRTIALSPMARKSAAGVALIAAGMLLATGQLAAQQPPHWRFFTSSDGLRESWVLDVTPGSNGRWWITHGNVDALSVFDGYTIRQLPSPGATVTVREGPTGQLWSLLPHPTVLDAYVGLQFFE